MASFGDVICLNDSRIGTIRFIGGTAFKNNVISYGVFLRKATGNNDGTDIFNRRYFRCPKKHGLFILDQDIKQIIKKQTVSGAFAYNQPVKVLNIGAGKIKYIGFTKFGSNYWYGVELQTSFNSNAHSESDASHYYLKPNETNIYFDADPLESVFVRSNQLQSIAMHSISAFPTPANRTRTCSVYDTYSVTFKSKPFGLTFGANKNDKLNLFVVSIGKNSVAEKHNVMLGSELIKLQNEIVENLGSKQIYKIYTDKYSKQLPLKITFAKPRQLNFDDEKSEQYIDNTIMAMMNSLKLPKKARKSILSKDAAQKLLLLKQWFITPYRPVLRQSNSEPITPSTSDSHPLTPSTQNTVASRKYSFPDTATNIEIETIRNRNKCNRSKRPNKKAKKNKHAKSLQKNKKNIKVKRKSKLNNKTKCRKKDKFNVHHKKCTAKKVHHKKCTLAQKNHLKQTKAKNKRLSLQQASSNRNCLKQSKAKIRSKSNVATTKSGKQKNNSNGRKKKKTKVLKSNSKTTKIPKQRRKKRVSANKTRSKSIGKIKSRKQSKQKLKKPMSLKKRCSKIQIFIRNSNTNKDDRKYSEEYYF